MKKVLVILTLLCSACLVPLHAEDARAAARPQSSGKNPAPRGKAEAPIVPSRSIIKKSDDYIVSAAYPITGNKVLDAEVEIWVNTQIRTFVYGVESIASPDRKVFYRLNVEYELVEVSPECLSLVFHTNTYTGSSPWDAPNQGVATFVYNLPDGRKLGYEDIFSSSAGLLEFLSNYCQEELLMKLGPEQQERIKKGASPKMLNFQYFIVTPSGMNIYFPAYQVAVPDLGEQKVEIPLKKLRPFGPEVRLWGSQASTAFPLNRAAGAVPPNIGPVGTVGPVSTVSPVSTVAPVGMVAPVSTVGRASAAVPLNQVQP